MVAWKIEFWKSSKRQWEGRNVSVLTTPDFALNGRGAVEIEEETLPILSRYVVPVRNAGVRL